MHRFIHSCGIIKRYIWPSRSWYYSSTILEGSEGTLLAGNPGWLKLHRQTLENRVFREDPTAWRLFEVLMMLCDYRTGVWRGGRKQLEAASGIKENTVRDALKRLRRHGMVELLDTRSGSRNYSEYSICNWSNFQGDDTHADIRAGIHPASTQHPPDTTIKRTKETKKDIGDQPTAAAKKPKPDDPVAKAYYDAIRALQIPTVNNTQIKSAITRLKRELGSEKAIRYLQYVATDYAKLDTEYKPEITKAYDIYSKYGMVKAALLRHQKEAQKTRYA